MSKSENESRQPVAFAGFLPWGLRVIWALLPEAVINYPYLRPRPNKNQHMSRATVLQRLTAEVGFQFDELQLSPSLRQKIGVLANTRQQLDANESALFRDQQQIVAIASEEKGSKNRILIAWLIAGTLIFIGILGTIAEAFASSGAGVGAFVFFFVVPGLTFLLYGYQIRANSGKYSIRLEAANNQVASTHEIIKKVNASYLSQVSAISQQILLELSSIYESRITPPASTLPPVLKETVLREVVMIPCSYCRGLMPQTSVFCPHCGAQRKG